MNENFDNNQSNPEKKRFIFSDTFYEQIPEIKEKKVTFDKVSTPQSLKKEKETIEIPMPKLENNIESEQTENYDLFNTNIVNQQFQELPTEKTDIKQTPVIEQPEEIPVPKKDFLYGNLDVETGINVALEEELMAPEIPTATIINNQIEEKKPEKMLYRVERRKREEPEPIPQVTNDSIINQNPPKEEISLDLEENQQPPIINIDEELRKEQPIDIQTMIEEILDIPDLQNIRVPISKHANPGLVLKKKKQETPKIENAIITYDESKDDFEYDVNLDNMEVIKSDLLDQLRDNANKIGDISVLARYGDDFCSRDYLTNPAIGRKEEIKQIILALLIPEKSAILVGKPGIGKTSIVEGFAYQLQRNNVPDALKGYRIISVQTTSLIGTLPSGETRLQTLVDELKNLDKVILFIDEIHMLMGNTIESAMDFANMFKESLGRGGIKMIGATTTEEYERYILRDKAFVRRFERIDVEEPSREQTIKILIGTLPKIEKTTGAKLKYTSFVQSEIMGFIVDITSEYKRVYGIGSRYPDICLTLLSQAFSQAVFDNRKEVSIFDIRQAIANSKNIYPDVISKELINFDEKFKKVIAEDQ